MDHRRYTLRLMHVYISVITYVVTLIATSAIGHVLNHANWYIYVSVQLASYMEVSFSIMPV